MPIFGRKKRNKYENHIRNLVMMAKADDFIDATEIEIIIDLGVAKGMEEQKIRALLRDKKEQKIIPPDNDRDKLEQIYDLILVMVADGIIMEDEMAFISRFADKLGWKTTSGEFIINKIIEGMQAAMSRDEIFENAKEYIEQK